MSCNNITVFRTLVTSDPFVGVNDKYKFLSIWRKSILYNQIYPRTKVLCPLELNKERSFV